jgi:hypothetical protein
VDDPGLRIFLAACILLIGAYFIGLRVNRRTGRVLARWVRDGLTVTGGDATIRWLGSSGFVIEVGDLEAPLAHMTVTALLLPREVALLWLYYHLRGRQDALVVRCRLVHPPRAALEILSRTSVFTRGHLARLEAEPGWTVRARDGFAIATRPGAEHVAERLWELFRDLRPGVWQMSVRDSDPHLQVGLLPRSLRDATSIFGRVAEAARLAGAGAR